MKDWTGNSRSAHATLGARNYALEERETNDYYATEPKALELLLQEETFSKNVWECACGEGHLSKVLKAHGFKVLSTDLIDRGYGLGGIDFLQWNSPFDGDIITNPPYKFALEFVEKALELITDGHKVAMFLKLQFLEGKARRAFFDKAPPPNDLCIDKSPVLRYERRLRQVFQVERSHLRLVYMGKGKHRSTHYQMV